jgi:hypothetical protein
MSAAGDEKPMTNRDGDEQERAEASFTKALD